MSAVRATEAWPPRPLPLPPRNLHSELLLRRWEVDDAEALASAWAEPTIRAWLDPPSAEVAVARRWIAGEAERRAEATALDLVVELDGSIVGEIGFSSFHVERRASKVGYWIGTAHRGSGLGARSLAIATAWFLSATAGAAVVASCDPGNVASRSTAERAGFRLLGPSGGSIVYACRSTAELSLSVDATKRH